MVPPRCIAPMIPSAPTPWWWLRPSRHDAITDDPETAAAPTGEIPTFMGPDGLRGPAAGPRRPVDEAPSEHRLLRFGSRQTTCFRTGSACPKVVLEFCAADPYSRWYSENTRQHLLFGWGDARRWSWGADSVLSNVPSTPEAAWAGTIKRDQQ